ncbi:MAG: hypothetical protein K6F82_00850 [Sphaerochaetaceae bacterium]|nr:hypothetical protein [Sphaerochaetaceae bacterium]
MKKISFVFVILLVFITLFPVFAGKDEDFSVTYGMGNDSFTRGLSRNEDDFKSFGLYMDYEFKDYNIYLDLDAYTFKEEDYRYDFLTIGVLKTFSFDDYYTFCAGLGLQTKGKLGGQSMQNYLHKLTRITEVNIPYETDEYDFTVRASAEGYLDSVLSPYLYAHTGFDALVKAGIKLKTGASSSLYLTYSYDAFDTHGLNFRMESDYGFIYTDYETNFLSRYGYGIIAVNPFKKMNGNKTTVTGSEWMSDYGKYSMYEIRIPAGENITSFINVKYETGEVDHNVSVRKEDNWYTAGAGYTFFDRVELRAFAGAHYYEQRENNGIDNYTKPVFGLGARIKALEFFNIYLNAEAGVIWEREFHFFAGYSITI